MKWIPVGKRIGAAVVVMMIAGFLSCLPAARAKTLKVALLPIPDVLPFHLAQAKGYFQEADVQVRAVPVVSPIDRDQLMQAGEIDGMLTELTTTAYFNREKEQIRIIRIARSPVGPHALFRILASPGSGLKTAKDLSGVPIAVSKNTIIEYVTDRLLTARGLQPDQIMTKSVPVIPERFQLLMQGQIRAATLPEPLATSAMAAGAMEIVEDSAYPELSVSVLSFSVASLESDSRLIRAFIRAWDRAAAEINEAPDAHRALLLEKIRVPKNIQETFAIPRFPVGKIPSRTQWEDVMDWMTAKGLLSRPSAYERSVSSQFLP